MVADRCFQIGNVNFRNCDWNVLARSFRWLPCYSHDCGRSQLSVHLVLMVEAITFLVRGTLDGLYTGRRERRGLMPGVIIS